MQKFTQQSFLFCLVQWIIHQDAIMNQELITGPSKKLNSITYCKTWTRTDIQYPVHCISVSSTLYFCIQYIVFLYLVLRNMVSSTLYSCSQSSTLYSCMQYIVNPVSSTVYSCIQYIVFLYIQYIVFLYVQLVVHCIHSLLYAESISA